MSKTATIHDLASEDAAERIFTAHRRTADSFGRTIDVWDVSRAEVARLFCVSGQAIGKWLRRGVPSERAGAVANLAAATDLLVHYLKRHRIPAVVRRPIPALGGTSLIGLLPDSRSHRDE